MTDWTYVVVVFLAGVVLCLCLWFQERRIKAMIESDKVFKKTGEDKNGVKTEQEGRTRSRWDYSCMPTLERMGMKVDPKLILATCILVLLTTLWVCTKEEAFLDLVKVNFGALLGTLVATNDPTKDS